MTDHKTPFRRAQHVKRGINLSHWFSQVYNSIGYTEEHFNQHMTAEDIQLIKELGFDHVRFPIACEPMMQTDSVPQDYLNRIGEVITCLHANELSVIVDIHPETPFKEALAKDDAAVDRFVKFWGEFAAFLSPFDPELTLLEIINEPCLGDPKRLSAVLQRCVQAIRHATQEHTLVISGDQWSQLPQLLRLDFPQDLNCIANFHMYEPSSFTHQGAKWANAWMQQTKGLTYPAHGSSAAHLLELASDPDASEQLREYLDLDWKREVYVKYLEPAIELREKLGVPVMCNEFGVYKEYCDRASRLKWTHDVIQSFEAADIGWSMWDFGGDFSIVNGPVGARIPDHELLQAMGMKALTDVR
jgi:aryl-phospho-beta-D-glucosidase BglC (GH1 family)